MSVPLSAFLTAWTILALNLLTPGPNVLNTITTAMGSGRAAGLASAAAVGLGIGIWCLGMSLGVATMFRAVPGAQETLTVLAAILLVYFASRYLRAALVGQASALASRGGLSLRMSFLRSLSVNATNPKALTTWLAVLGIFPTGHAAAPDIALLLAGASGAGMAIHAAYALLFSTPPSVRVYLRAAPVINGAVGIFFMIFAVKLTAPLLARAI
ncbi:MAG: LysE family transporter [Rhodobacter sp.]|nr:LysE family transporter [Rhodobacter sp.]